jgi:hypothetical protein
MARRLDAQAAVVRTLGLGAAPSWAIAGLVLLASGCITSRTYQPATTLGKGVVAADGELAGQWQFPPRFDLHAEAIAGPAVGLAYGVTDWFDARLTLSGEAIGLQTKFALLQDREAGGFTVSLAPHIAGLTFFDAYTFSWELPLLVGYRWSERTEWVLAATTKDWQSVEPVERGIPFFSRTWGGTASVHHLVGKHVRLTGGVGAFQSRGQVGWTPWNGLQAQAVVGLAFLFEAPRAEPQRRAADD